MYTVDMDVKKLLNLEPRTWDFIDRLEPKLGLVEYMSDEKASADLINMLHDCNNIQEVIKPEEGKHNRHKAESFKLPSKKPKVAIVGSGPSGLFAALVLGELGADVTLIERGQAVEQRGRDIGALVVRRILQSESNFCFGEVCSISICTMHYLSVRVSRFLVIQTVRNRRTNLIWMH